MGRSCSSAIPAAVGILLLASLAAQAATITKDDNATNLPQPGSWIGGVAPGSGDIANWSGTYNTAGSLTATYAAALNWNGISVGQVTGTAATGTIFIGGNGGAPAASMTLGAGGIDMSQANQNLVLNANWFAFNTSQTWNVPSGRNLRLARGPNCCGADVDGSDANAVITVTGGGVIDLNQGGVSGFNDAAGFANFAGKWQINAGTTLRAVRNGATAFGTNTSTDAILLNGGTLATGGITGANGNWTWNTPMQLATGTTSALDQQLPSGNSTTNRSLILHGVISGSGNLTFLETGVTNAFGDDNFGYILTGTNTMSGTVTIGGATENGIAGRLSSVRVGGDPSNTSTATGGGVGGTLGTATVINNGVLTFSRTDAHTVANNIMSGSGSLRIGAAGINGTTTQDLTYTGVAAYTGTTAVNTGTLRVTGTGQLYATGGFFGANNTTYVTVASGATLEIDRWAYGPNNSLSELRANHYAVSVTGGTLRFVGTDASNAGPNNLRAFQIGAGGATLEVTSGSAFHKEAGTIASQSIIFNLGNNPLTLTGGGMGQIDDDLGAQGTWQNATLTKNGIGVWTLGGVNTYGGATAINDGTLQVNGTHTGGAAYTVATAGTLGGTGTIALAAGNTVNVVGTLAPGAGIGTLSVLADTTLDGTYLLESNAAGSSDSLDVIGVLNLGGSSVLALDALSSLSSTSTYTIASYTSLNGTFGMVDSSILATHVVDYLTDNQVRLVPVPEPGSAVLLLAGWLGLVAGRRARGRNNG